MAFVLWVGVGGGILEMREYVNIGSSPVEEDCAQVGDPDYPTRAREECRRFIELIRMRLGPEPEGARLVIKAFPHDFGTYHEVVCWYDDEMPKSVDYAFKCESDAPSRWEE
jgi:hypothetical protein